MHGRYTFGFEQFIRELIDENDIVEESDWPEDITREHIEYPSYAMMVER